MSERWYYAWDDTHLGPVSWEQLQELVARGEVLRDDLVWQTNTPAWKAAETVEGLPFPPDAPVENSSHPEDNPPPLPMRPRSVARTPMAHMSLEDRVNQALCWAKNHKGWACLAVVALCLLPLAVCLVVDERPPEELVYTCLFSAAFFGAAASILGTYRGVKQLSQFARATQLRQKWEDADDNDRWLQFCADGGVIGSQGFAAKYKYDPQTDVITLTPFDGTDHREWQVISLSAKDFAYAENGTTRHLRRPNWWRTVQRNVQKSWVSPRAS